MVKFDILRPYLQFHHNLVLFRISRLSRGPLAHSWVIGWDPRGIRLLSAHLPEEENASAMEDNVASSAQGVASRLVLVMSHLRCKLSSESIFLLHLARTQIEWQENEHLEADSCLPRTQSQPKTQYNWNTISKFPGDRRLTVSQASSVEANR